MLRFSLLLGVIYLLSACSVGPDYNLPELDLPTQFHEGRSQNEELNTFWWDSFQDETLTSLIERAVEQNKEVRQALSRINQSRALAREAFGELLPGSQLGSAFEKSRVSGLGFPGGTGFDLEKYSAKADASWEIDIFGRLRRNLEAKEADYAGKIAELHDTLLIVIAEVGNVYFELRGAQARLRVAEANLSIQEDTVGLVKAKLDAGAVSELDAARALTQLEQTRATVPPLRATVKQSIYRLAVLLGKYPKELEAELSEWKEIPSYGGPVEVGSPEELLRRRPDIRSAERQLASYTAQVGVQVGELFPKITFLGNLGLDGTEFSQIVGAGGNRLYSWGPSITWTPFDTGRIRARVKAADERANEALYSYELVVLEAIEDVESSLVIFSSEREKKLQLEKAFSSAKRAHELAKEQYKEGVIDLLSVLDAQSIMLDVDDSLSSSREKLGNSLIQIYKALGGGWEVWEVGKVKES